MANPVYNSSNETIKWQPEPTFRGTFTIITTCAITLLLCVYSSVHLNLPAIVGDKTSNGLRRTGWIFCALFAPEYIIFTAQMQRARAKELSKEACEAFKPTGASGEDNTESGLPARRHPWTSAHSFWASMGGIAIKPSSSHPEFIPNSITSTLTANGVSLLLKKAPHLLPDLSLAEIKDKSRSSSLTKLLACLQATWFCLSTITRFAQHLPVSMLEVNSLAHALCTLAAYMLWWHKPLNVSQPVVISDEELDPLLAYMWMSSSTSAAIAKSVEDDNITYAVGTDPEFEAILLSSEEPSPIPSNPSEEVASEQHNSSSSGEPPSYTSNNTYTEFIPLSTTSILVTPTTPLPGTTFLSNPSSTRWIEVCTETTGSGDDVKTSSTTSNLPPTHSLTPLSTNRWRLAYSALTKYSLSKPAKNLDMVTTNVIAENIDENNNFIGHGQDTKQPLGGFILMLILAAGYGALHATAWNAEFPSQTERTLWRVAVCVVASPIVIFCGAVMVLAPIELLGWNGDENTASVSVSSSTSPVNPTSNDQPQVSEKLSPLPKYSEKDEEKIEQPQQRQSTTPSTPRKIFNVLWRLLKRLTLIVLTIGLAFLYVPARAYLVYESVRTVFLLPPGAFETATWTQYLVHVT
ncbi:hypothetical protein VTL71DRAFT_12367 [Oculimacula yallundae]|uniref:Uncharacterized protein n=1 Tax=Oculimacula yallundae TaxID=86028 RepID=A0ABR4CNL9_9HELO